MQQNSILLIYQWALSFSQYLLPLSLRWYSLGVSTYCSEMYREGVAWVTAVWTSHRHFWHFNITILPIFLKQPCNYWGVCEVQFSHLRVIQNTRGKKKSQLRDKQGICLFKFCCPNLGDNINVPDDDKESVLEYEEPRIFLSEQNMQQPITSIKQIQYFKQRRIGCIGLVICFSFYGPLKSRLIWSASGFSWVES